MLDGHILLLLANNYIDANQLQCIRGAGNIDSYIGGEGEGVGGGILSQNHIKVAGL